ncbi:hypothetical protein B0T19DRAFT_473788 [Cercophora scortea]|uniref:NACHT domain-containing protein n=1 Tax=Cercophora scortea TaxID=314031 RepID=A0AAE0MHQ0_9PEZI|nr:hypothetical protein B0T19DRAFT_473788 [Cercophora scortea]
MDPVSAVGLVAGICGIAQFAAEVIAVAKRVHKNGTSEDLTQLERSGDAMQAATNLIIDKGPPLFTQRAIPPEDLGFIRLAEAGVQISREITSLLDEVRGAADGKRWKTLRQAFKTVWKQGTIDQLNTQLAQVRSNLQLHTVILIKTKLDKESMRIEDVLKSLDDNAKSLLPAFLPNLDELKVQGDIIIKNQLQSEALALARHEELLNALDAIDIGSAFVDRATSDSEQKLTREEVAEIKKDVEQALLLSLWFPTMADREETIHQAYQRTYEWIYSDPQVSQKPWDNLNRFLSVESGAYWITGKAGSGKSTLMKYVVQHHRTRSLLKQWARGSQLVTAAHYFYYKGSALQKSELGVLRSLLHQILYNRKDLLEVAFPERYKVMFNGGTKFEPQIQELKRALKNVITGSPSTYFFIAVDGLDEYDGGNTDMAFLVKTFKDLSVYPNVKTLLSSRPWVVFEENFAECPRLRLHELTKPDISRYVHDVIGAHPRSVMLMSRHSSKVRALMAEIVDTSAGVFLWVYLVVRSLLEGLTNHDSLDDLRARFREFPVELGQLYHHMWDRIPQQYRAQAARLLQLIEIGTAEGSKLSLMGLSLAEEDAEYVYDIPIQPLSEEEVSERVQTMKIRLLSRCIGLVEVHNREEVVDVDHLTPSFNSDLYPNELERKHGYPDAAFLHRTVYEFVSSPEIHQILQEAASPCRPKSGTRDSFCPESVLLSSTIARLKTLADMKAMVKPDEQWVIFPTTIETLVYRSLILAREAENTLGLSQTALLQELDKTMTHFMGLLSRGTIWAGYHWHAALYFQGELDGDTGGSDRHYSAKATKNLLSLAVRHGLVHSVRDMMNARDTHTHSQQQQQQPQQHLLLDFALRPSCSRFGVESSLVIPRVPAMVNLLLESGADPNEKYDDTMHRQITIENAADTVWKKFLVWLSAGSSMPANVPEILASLIRHGADLQATIRHAVHEGEITPRRLCEYLSSRLEWVEGDKQEFEAGMTEVFRLLLAREKLEDREVDLIHGLDGPAARGGGLTPVEELGMDVSSGRGYYGRGARERGVLSRFKRWLRR